jgi:hypothetical protein
MSDEPGALMRRRVQGQMEDELVRRGASKITAAEANERFPGMPVAFKEDEFPEVAQLKWDDHQRRLKLAEWSDRGGGSPWGSELAVGLLGGFLDPLNLAVGVATGAAGGALASRLAIARGGSAKTSPRISQLEYPFIFKSLTSNRMPLLQTR